MSAPQKTKASTAVTVKALKSPEKETLSAERNARSTSTQAQRERILAALRDRPQTTEDLRKIGLYAVAARVKELRDAEGFRIDTALVTLYDQQGYLHRRAARYSLVAGAST